MINNISTSENNKRIAKNTLFLYIRMLFTLGVSLFTSRIVLAVLGADDLGTYGVVGGVVAMFSFLNGSLAGGTQRFLTFELGKNDFVKLKKTFSAALNIHILLAGVIFILAETIGLWFLINQINIPVGRENAALWVYQFSILTTCISIVQVPFNASIIARERMNIFAYVSIVDVLLKLLIVYLLTVSGYDKLITYAALYFVVTIVITSIYLFYCRKQFSECRFGLFYDKSLYTSMLSYSGWNLLGCGAVMGATQGVNILLNLFFNTAVNAARGLAVQVNTAVSSFVNNFQIAINPQIIKYYAGERIPELHSLLFNNSKFSFSIMWILSLPLFLKLDIVLRIWLTEVPEYTAIFCRLILLQSLIYCMQRPFVMACHAVGKMRIFQLAAASALLLILPLSYLFLKLGFPAYVPFIIYIITTGIEFIVELCLCKIWIHLSFMKFFKTVIGPVLIVILTSFPLPFFLSNVLDNSYLSFFIVCVLSIINAALSICFFVLDKSLRQKIIHLIRTKISLK